MKVPRLIPRLALAVGVGLLLLPAGASAASGPASVAPPGSAAVDQYRESAPPAGSHGHKLDARQKRKLEAQGKDGAALAAVIDRNGGMPGGGGSADDGSAGGASAASGLEKKKTEKTSGTRDRRSGDADRSVQQAQLPADRSAATSTVGPFPIWTLLVLAAVLVGLALIVRRRPSA